MKQLLFTLFALVFCITTYAQSVPQGMKYQAVARDQQGQILANHDINLRIALNLGEKDKSTVYSETHQVRTNDLGLFAITIGEGDVLRGTFINIPWSSDEIWMEIALDENKTGEYFSISSSKLLAVPYAFHAGSAEKLSETEESQRNGGIYWHILGNSNTIPGITFVGTTDFKDLVFKTNSIEAMRISAVDQELQIQGDLSVGNNALIGNDLEVANDASIGNDLDVDGIARFNNTTESTTKDDGAVIVEGGVGIEKNTNIGGNAEVDGTLGVDGISTFKNTTGSTSKDNGAVVIEGGLGVEENTNIGGNTEVDGTLGVDGISTFKNTTGSTSKDDGAVVIEGGLGVEENANIGGNADVTGTLDVDGLTSLFAGLRVENNSATVLTGTLGVDGLTDLNAGLNVNNATATYLSGTLTVDGITTFNNLFTVDHTIVGSQSDQTSYPMLIKGSEQGLAIQVTKSWSNEFTDTGRGNNYISFWTDANTMTGRVEGMTRADLDPTGLLSLVGDLIAIDVTNVNESPNILGSLSLPSFSSSSFIDDILGSLVSDVDYSNPSNSSFDPGSLGSNITDALSDPIGGFISSFNGINGTTPANALWQSISAELCDPNGIFVQGAGQEAVTNWKSQLFSNYTLDILQGGISTIANLITLITSFFSVLDPEDIFEKTVSILADVINLVIYGSYADINIGVAYESGSGDYAEWLERAHLEEQIKAGDVVGVIGGKVSKHFTSADKFMVVSTAPIVLGNMPEEAIDEANFEKVAFMGQVPVRVQGEVKIGDYILPSGLSDGMAIAVAPHNMKARDYQRIVGVAWANSTPGQYINLINTAVGINNNDLGRVIEDMQFTLNQLQIAMQQVNPDYKARMYDVDEPLAAIPSDMTLSPTHPAYVSSYFEGKTYEDKEALCADVKKALVEQAGVSFEEVPVLEFLLDNPDRAAEVQPYFEEVLEHLTAMRDSFQASMEAEKTK